MRIAQKSRSFSASLPAPFGGWNSRDALADMEPTDAVELINWFPRRSDVMLRKGYERHVTGISGQVQTLMAYASPSANQLFGIAGSSIYNVSNSGAVGAAVVTGLTNAKWEYINVATSGGNFLYAVNGVDKPLIYNGTTWTSIDAASTPAITGVTTTNLTHINLFKTRVWFVEKDTLKVWYLPVNSVGGAANAVDFQSIARRGGYVVAMGTWTIDAGYGVDDLAVFITSQGEVIVYRGTDPSSASTWALVGVWQLGSPIGKRCFLKFAGDILLITKDGVVPLSEALQSSRVNPRVAVTDKIQPTVSNSASLYSSNFGWQLLYYPKGNMLFLNVPIEDGDNQEQYVMNTVTKSWARFQDWNANCWELFSDEPYFGASGFVGKAWSTLSDNATNINGTAKQAFNYFGHRGKLKRWTMIRPVLLTNGTPSVYANLNIDFENSGTTSLLSFTLTGSSLLDSATWDSGTWGTDIIPQKSWQGATGVGYCAAPRLQAACMGIDLSWVSTDIIMERGAFL